MPLEMLEASLDPNYLGLAVSLGVKRDGVWSRWSLNLGWACQQRRLQLTSAVWHSWTPQCSAVRARLDCTLQPLNPKPCPSASAETPAA